MSSTSLSRQEQMRHAFSQGPVGVWYRILGACGFFIFMLRGGVSLALYSGAHIALAVSQ